MRVFITGGAGYVGSHCAKLLRSKGHELLIYDNLSNGHIQAVPPDELVVADLGDTGQLRTVISDFKPHAVMHFAASAVVSESVCQPLNYYRNNVINTITMLETMQQLGIDKLVFSSSCAVYGRPPATPIREEMPCKPLSPYGQTKLIMEQVLADCRTAWNLGYATLRYFNASGAADDGSLGEDHHPETHLIPLVLQVALGRIKQLKIFGNDYDTPDGTCIRDYIHVEDLAQAHLLALETIDAGDRMIYNLGTGTGHSVHQVVQAARKVTGKQIPEIIAPARPGDCAILYADAAKIKNDLGWEAKIDQIETIIASAWKWHQKNPHGYADQ